MAKTEATRPDGRRIAGWIPVAVALVAVGLFLGWLATTRPEEAVVVAEPDTGQTTDDDMTDATPATLIAPGELVQNAAQYVGQTVELESVAVIGALGPSLFWMELPGGTPFLVKLGDTQIERGVQAPQPGATCTWWVRSWRRRTPCWTHGWKEAYSRRRTIACRLSTARHTSRPGGFSRRASERRRAARAKGKEATRWLGFVTFAARARRSART
jgi:hypothetical protein